jgi:Leucine-rich repeat (LRR) protein
MLEKIVNLLKTGSRNSIELAYQLSLSKHINLWPIERSLKDLLFAASSIQVPIQFDKLPLGQLCYVLKEVIAIDFNDSHTTELPNYFDFMPALVILEIHCRSLQSIGTSIEQLKALKSLSIKHTQIKSIPFGISSLPKLESLNISHNKRLTSIPADIYAAKSLKKLRICAQNVVLIDQERAKFDVIIVP